MGGISLKCVYSIGDYAHAGCRLTNAFKKRLTKIVATLTMGVVGVRQIASDFADSWSMMLADVNHVAPTDRLFQRTTKAEQSDINTSMLFFTDPSTMFEMFMVPGSIFRTPCSEVSYCGHLLKHCCAIWVAKTPCGGKKKTPLTMVRCKRPRVTAAKSVRHGSNRVGSQPHGSTREWLIIEWCSKNRVNTALLCYTPHRPGSSQ